MMRRFILDTLAGIAIILARSVVFVIFAGILFAPLFVAVFTGQGGWLLLYFVHLTVGATAMMHRSDE